MSATRVRGMPTWDLVGLYPTWEGLGVQLASVGAALLLLGSRRWRRGGASRVA